MRIVRILPSAIVGVLIGASTSQLAIVLLFGGSLDSNGFKFIDSALAWRNTQSALLTIGFAVVGAVVGWRYGAREFGPDSPAQPKG